MTNFIKKNLKYIAVLQFVIILILLYFTLHLKKSQDQKLLKHKQETKMDRQFRLITYPPGASISCSISRKIIKSETPFDFKLNEKIIKVTIQKKGFNDTLLTYNLSELYSLLLIEKLSRKAIQYSFPTYKWLRYY